MAPVQVESDPHRGDEPFIRLPAPFSNYVVTPPRFEDGETSIVHMSHPSVYMSGSFIPHPYTGKDWQDWYNRTSEIANKAREEFDEVRRPSSARKYTDACPMKSIREVDPVTNVQTFIGDISFIRNRFFNITNLQERDRLKEENDKRESGDPEIEYEIGFYLGPEYQGKGIMTHVLKTMLESYAVPYLNAHNVMADYMVENIGSRRVFEKNGFVFEGIAEDAVELSESKGGGKKSLGIVRWRRPTA